MNSSLRNWCESCLAQFSIPGTRTFARPYESWIHWRLCSEGYSPQSVEAAADGLDVDRDTLNGQRSPEIAETILKKIERCYVFVADVTIVNPDVSDSDRKTPNPNVF